MTEELEWTPNMEKLLRTWGRQVQKSARSHAQLARTYKTRNILLGGPAVVLGGLASGASFSMLRQCTEEETYCTATRLGVSILMVTSTAFMSLKSFMNYDVRAKEHSQAADRFDALARTINNTLAYDRARRGNPVDIMTSIRNQYELIVGNAPSLKGEVAISDELQFVRIEEDSSMPPPVGSDVLDIEAMGSNIMADVRMQEAVERAIKDNKSTKRLPASLKYQMDRFSSMSTIRVPPIQKDTGAGVGAGEELV